MCTVHRVFRENVMFSSKILLAHVNVQLLKVSLKNLLLLSLMQHLACM